MRAVAFLAFVGAASSAWALPIGPVTFCEHFPNSPTCVAGIPSCAYCHSSPPDRNAYGEDVASNLLLGAPRPLTGEAFSEGLGAALDAVQDLDSDLDGYNNATEILEGSLPGSAGNKPRETNCDAGKNPFFKLCEYDPVHAYKKLNLDFCGRSASYSSLKTFAALDLASQTEGLQQLLDQCLDSAAWLGKDGQLWELAHRKIRPLQAIKAGDDGGPIPLSDYYDDYALFVYVNSDDRDVRDLLTAEYFVIRDDNTTYTPTDTIRGQNVGVERRAGMLTTSWNLVNHIMFTALPRTAAAQAYRAYLNLDIARLEGIQPVEGEPKDYDAKGVKAEACARCHSTLDPLTYPFRNYNGLSRTPFGTYLDNRLERGFGNESPNIGDTPEAGVILGQPVPDLRSWAQVAAGSDEFAKAVVEDYWKLLIGEEPGDADPAFVMLWQDLKGRHGFQVERMLHALIQTEAYGAP